MLMCFDKLWILKHFAQIYFFLSSDMLTNKKQSQEDTKVRPGTVSINLLTFGNPIDGR